tara:strand:+ start:2375 stop:3394 length:1020 start_codon:yes stop_codon:yes gene_type:complete
MPLDIVTTHNSDTYEHHRLDDCSLFTERGKVRRVPIDALLSKPDLTPTGEVIQEIVTPKRLDGYSALINAASGELLDTRPIGKSYNLVPHDLLFAKQADLLWDSELPTDNVKVIDRLYDGGLKAHRTVLFDDLASDVGKNGDRVQCRMDVFNSVDMSWAFQIFSGAYRDLCRNTLVFGGEKAYHQKRKHTRNLAPEAVINKATMGLNVWQNNRDQMKRWSGSTMSRDDFANVLAGTICKKKTEAAQAGQGSQVNETLMNRLLHGFQQERQELGNTMWAGYNALTDWSTHTDKGWTNGAGQEFVGQKKTAQTHNVQRQRMDMVRNVLASPAWNSFERVAA